MTPLRSASLACCLVLPLAALAAACADETVDAATIALRFEEPFAVRDSAGVTIAESAAPLWNEGEGWTVDPEPELVVGMVDGPDDYLFQSVRSVHRLPDDGVVFGEAGDGTVRRFDADGDIVWKEGGEGQGPGEFQCLAGLHVQGESVLAWQCNPVAAGVRYSLDGDVLEILPTRAGAAGPVVGAYTDGDLLLLGRRDVGAQVEVSERIVRVHRPFMRAREDRIVDTLLVLPYRDEMLLPIIDESENMLLSPEIVHRLDRDTLYAGFNERYDVRVYDGEGGLVRIVRRAFEPEPVDMGWVNDLIDQAVEEELEEREDPWERRAFRMAVAAYRRVLVFPDYMPAYSEIRTALDGHLWVRTDVDRLIRVFDLDMPPAPGHWDVFDPGGRWLGEVVTPPSFTIHEIGDDYVLGVVTNEVDVQFVVRYALEKGGDDPGSAGTGGA